MKRIPLKAKPVQTKRELESLNLTFNKVRVLHYAEAEALSCAAISARLRKRSSAVNSNRLHQLLTSMVLKGWLKAKGTSTAGSSAERKYSLTPKGSRMLRTARKHLRHLVDTNLAPATS